RLGSVYSTCPIALRFVRRSNAFLSMMSGRDTMMVELIQLADTPGGIELLASYEEALYGLCGRPHWGQHNSIGARRVDLEQLCPELDTWLAVYSELTRRAYSTRRLRSALGSLEQQSISDLSSTSISRQALGDRRLASGVGISRATELFYSGASGADLVCR